MLQYKNYLLLLLLCSREDILNTLWNRFFFKCDNKLNNVEYKKKKSENTTILIDLKSIVISSKDWLELAKIVKQAVQNTVQIVKNTLEERKYNHQQTSK